MKKTNQYLGPSRLNMLLLEKAKICRRPTKDSLVGKN